MQEIEHLGIDRLCISLSFIFVGVTGVCFDRTLCVIN
jgi:hypothetical protein